jgi:AhpC/TSA family
MTRQRNFLPLGGFLVCLVGFVSYFVLFVRFPVTRDLPWASWLLFAAGLALAVAGVARAFRRPETYRGRILGPVLGVLSLAVVGFFLFATLVATRQMPAAPNVPKVGQKAPTFTLPDSQGRPVALQELVGPGKPWIVLIFYRGYW